MSSVVQIRGPTRASGCLAGGGYPDQGFWSHFERRTTITSAAIAEIVCATSMVTARFRCISTGNTPCQRPEASGLLKTCICIALCQALADIALATRDQQAGKQRLIPGFTPPHWGWPLANAMGWREPKRSGLQSPFATLRSVTARGRSPSRARVAGVGERGNTTKASKRKPRRAVGAMCRGSERIPV